MFTRILAMLSVTTVLIENAEAAPASARQFLTGYPGYIPVYIRAGDTPLEAIDPTLADAFDSYARRHGRMTRARSIGTESGRSGGDEGFPDIDDVDATTTESDNNEVDVPLPPSVSHIQKIPRDLTL